MKQTLFRDNSTLPLGLLPELVKFLKESGYEYTIKGNFNTSNFSEIEALEFIKTLNIPSKFTIRDYQLKYFIKCVRNSRGICISPTNSGKSLIAYLLFRYYNQKTLITVPTGSLVYQLKGDFKDYGYEGEVHTITAGIEKNTDKLCTISTWQSIYKQNKTFFDDFKVVIGDEVHSNKSPSLIKLMNMLTETPIRIGLTGTLLPVELHNKQIQGLFGPVMEFISQDELIKRGISSPLLIKAIVLNHNKEMYSPMDWEDEVPYLLSHAKRNEFIVNLACSLKGNTFIMFRNIDHGKNLYEEIKKKSKFPIYYVDGQTGIKEREELRKIIENSENSCTVASLVFNAGINISSINNIIFTHPSKSRVRILQAIGRGLRINPSKNILTLFDLSDRLNPNFQNVTYHHLNERLKIYKKEKFEVKSYSINL